MTENAIETVKSYLASWSIENPTRRQSALEQILEPEFVYVDPTGRAQGRDAFDAHIAAVQSLFVGHHLNLSSGVDEHYGALRFEWELRDANSVTVMAGIDFCQLSPSGKMQSVTGFFGPTPPLDAL